MLCNYFNTRFPEASIDFQYAWAGLIGITKDLVPIAGFDHNNSSLYYVAGCTGLPWAAACGHYAVLRILELQSDMDHYLNPGRAFPCSGVLQKILGNRITFALSNLITMYNP
jgi:glycine/D-amino acid oxidase-like deaminating enzyme